MAQPIYKVWTAKYKEAWYQLSEAEKKAYNARLAEAMKKVGCEEVMMISLWGTEDWQACGIEKFPSIEAVQQYSELLTNMDHYRYFESKSYLGTEIPG